MIGERGAGPPDLAGRALGPTRLTGYLGAGGTGVVYDAEMTAARPYAVPGTRVAVKVLHRHVAADADAFERFAREARVGSAVDHPGVVRAFEAGADVIDGTTHHFLVMEYLEGRTLRSLIRELSMVPEPLVRDLGRQAALGLHAIHEAGAVHRDLKPSNLLLTPASTVKLLDLGTARLVRSDKDLTRAGTFVGTLLYAAPERLRGQVVGPPADLYALGTVLYEAATGVQPFDSDDVQVVLRRHLDEIPTRASKLNPRLTPFLDHLLARLLEKDPARRFGSALELATVLEAGEASPWWRDTEAVLHAERPRGRLQRIRIAREARLVGRHRELAVMFEYYAEARAGQGRLLWIEGEAGVGKTRLVDGLLAGLEEQGAEFHFLYGSYAPGFSGSERGALADAVVGHFGLGLEPGLRRHLVASPTLAVAFAASLGSDVVNATAAAGVEPAVRDALFCQLAKSLAAEKPVVWVIEDLHFAGQGGWELLLALARIAQDRRLLLVATSRPDAAAERLPALTKLAALRRLKLARLDAAAVAELLGQTLGSGAIDRVGPVVARRSDGLPLFVLALAREFQGKTPSEALTAGEGDPAVPSSVRDHLLSRLNDTASAERALLDLAAVQGFSFEPDLLARALGRPRLAVLQALAALERRTRLVRATGAGCEFDHHLLQEVLYAEQPALLREEHHAVLAEAYERRLSEGGASVVSGESAAFLATHFLKGGRMEAAQRFLPRALEHLARHERSETVVVLAAEAIVRVGDSDPGLVCDLRLAQAERLHLLGRRAEQVEAVDAALAAARSLPDRLREGRCLLARGTYLRSGGDLHAAREAMESALAVAGDRRAEAKASLMLGILLLALVELDRSEELLRRSAELFHQLGDAIGEGDARRNLGRRAVLQPRYLEAEEHFTASLALYRGAGHRVGEGLSQGAIGILHTMRGEERSARAAFLEHLRLTRETGHRVAEANALHYLGHSSTELGRFAEAEDLLGQSLALAREAGERQVEMAAVQGLGRLWLHTGRLDRAATHFASNETFLRQIEERRWEAPAETDFAQLALYAGRVDEARSRLERGRSLAVSRGLRGQVVRATFELAAVALAEGRAPESRDLASEACDEARRLGEIAPGALAALALSRALLATGDAAAAVAPLLAAEAYARDEAVAYLGKLPTAYLMLAGATPVADFEVDHANWTEVQIETHLVLAQAGYARHLELARGLLQRTASFLPVAEQDGFWRGNPWARWLGRLAGCR